MHYNCRFVSRQTHISTTCHARVCIDEWRKNWRSVEHKINLLITESEMMAHSDSTPNAMIGARAIANFRSRILFCWRCRSRLLLAIDNLMMGFAFDLIVDEFQFCFSFSQFTFTLRAKYGKWPNTQVHGRYIQNSAERETQN